MYRVTPSLLSTSLLEDTVCLSIAAAAAAWAEARNPQARLFTAPSVTGHAGSCGLTTRDRPVYEKNFTGAQCALIAR